MMRGLIAIACCLAALVGCVDSAHAEVIQCNQAASCDQGRAYAECMAIEPTNSSIVAVTRRVCHLRQSVPGAGYYFAQYWGPNTSGSEAGPFVVGDFHFVGMCSLRAEELGWEGGGNAGVVNACHNGCLYTSSLDPQGVAGFSYMPTGATCTNADAPDPTPAGDGGDDDGGGTGGETGGGDGDGDGDGGGDGGDGGGDGEGGGNGDGDGDGDSDGGGDGDGDGDGDGENPSLPENPTYPGDIPMPYADPPIPSSYLGQWSSGLGGGSCPAAKTITVGVGSITTSVSFEFKPLCDFAQMIKGLVIACAALAAAYIVAGVRK